MKKYIILSILTILILGGCEMIGQFEGKTSQEWRDKYYFEDSAKVRLYNCVSESSMIEETKTCLNETPLP